MTTNRETLEQVCQHAEAIGKIEKMSKNCLSTFRNLSESIVQRLLAFKKSDVSSKKVEKVSNIVRDVEP
jgi:hypothetical protein